MRFTLLSLACLTPLCAGAGAAEPVRPAAPSGFAATNLTITCTNGFEGSQATGVAVFHGDVRVLEAQMYLECELLTLLSDTNKPSGPREAGPRESGPGMTNLNDRISTIIAETNLLIMTRDTTIIGDRAVYTASNDVLTVSGDLVILETDRSYTFCTNFVVNRSTGEGYVLGWNSSEFRSKLGADGTNAAPPGPSLPTRPRKLPVPGSKAEPRKGGSP